MVEKNRLKPPKIHSKVVKIARLLELAGATDLFLVGGYVRDYLLGIPSKDYDLEVYGLDYEAIIAAVKPYFRVNQVGKSFSVLKVDQWIDVTLPRREVKTGPGHREFDVVADGRMTFTEAASRRDFTINAIGMRMDGTLCDPYDGGGDLRRRILRAPTEAFCEDPLRVLRGMQFAARFGMKMEPRTAELSRRVLPEFGTLSAERIFEEWFKWAVRGDFPEMGLELLCETGWIGCFPELNAQVEQGVFPHTKTVCTRAAELARTHALAKNDRAVLMFGALCQDFGKAGAEEFLMRMKPPLWLPERVLPLVTEHATRPWPLREAVTDAGVRHLSARLAPANIRMWELLSTAEERARTDAQQEVEQKTVPACDAWAARARELGIYDGPPEPILQGRHLLQRGMEPGPGMGRVLKKAWNAQLDGAFFSLEEAFRWLEEVAE